MARNPKRLSEKKYDLLIVGAGINGAAIAWEAALRGLEVALIDKEDFGSGTSAGCFKIAHGGVRYLQHLNYGRLRESVREQRILRQIAPHHIRPLPFLIPCYEHGVKKKRLVSLAMSVYELLAKDRNINVPTHKELSSHKVLSKEEVLALAPGLPAEGLSGGVVYYDCQMPNSERLTYSVAHSAKYAGAMVLNYAQLKSFEFKEVGDQQTIKSCFVEDVIDGTEYKVNARQYILAAGPWATNILNANLRTSSTSKKNVFSKGIQLVTPRVIANYGLALDSNFVDPKSVVSGGTRSYFLHPLRGHTLIGTSDSLYRGDPENFAINKNEISKLISEVSEIYDSELLTPENVKFAFGGLRPIDESLTEEELSKEGIAKVAHEEEILDGISLAGKSIDNLVSVTGVKYTTFRSLAESVVDIMAKRFQKMLFKSKSSQTPIYRGPIDDYHRIYEPEEELKSGSGVLKADIKAICRKEMVEKLSDLVLRRTNLGTLGNPGDDVLRNLAELMAPELGWDEERVALELVETKSLFDFGP